MALNKGMKVRIYPNPQQQELLDKTFGSFAAFVRGKKLVTPNSDRRSRSTLTRPTTSIITFELIKKPRESNSRKWDGSNTGITAN